MYDPIVSELQTIDNITDKLEHRVSQSIKGDYLYLQIKLEDKFVINKTFLNNYDGRIDLQKARDSFNTEDKVKKYFGI
ncbi:MAG TPA: hypothetical protein VI911_11590 [Patescibacteria group bacterium]|nr:hypothetical protein [Patescibacteria group bacterium]